MKSFLIENGTIVNENRKFKGNILVENHLIKKISENEISEIPENCHIIDAGNQFVIPGIIDTHVHFREPGLTHKADIQTESHAAVSGGITSYMEMPNTIPPAISTEILEEKFRIAKEKSLANYSFYIGATNDNLDELLKVDAQKICGIKIFLGSSTGNMLANDETFLTKLFENSKVLLAIHSEDEAIIKRNLENFKAQYGENIPIEAHATIRSREACLKSTQYAIELAQKTKARIHLLHISTADELSLFSNEAIQSKNITAEVCVHHLYFDENDYATLGTKIKCNPSIKSSDDREKLFNALHSNYLDTISTDHAPHTISEKMQNYQNCPSGIPLVEYSLSAMMELYHDQKISMEKIVEKMCHNPAILFKINKRGFLRQGYFADIAIVNPKHDFIVTKQNILSKCNWSPFEGKKFRSKVEHTFVNGNHIFNNNFFNENEKGMRLEFLR